MTKAYNGAQLREDITLRRLQAVDASAMYRWMCDPEIAGNIGLSREPSLAASSEWIEHQARNPSIEAFGIVADGMHIGNAVLDQIDPATRRARFSIYLGEGREWAHGTGTAAGYLILQRGFGEFGLDSIWLTVHAENARAIASYRRLGFETERIVDDGFLLGDRRLPLVHMAITAFRFLELDGERGDA
jgi:RimJ/RimL family protein N-acetyltransferase